MMKNAEELLGEVKALNEQEEYEKVIELLPDNVLQEYNSSQLYSELAQALWRTGKYELCKIAATKAIELDNSNAKAYNYLGHCISESTDLKDLEKAEEYYLKAVEIDPKYAHPYVGLGNIYSDLKDYKKAEEYYKKAIEIDPKLAYPYNSLGNVYYNLKDYKKAEDYYLKAIEIDPKGSSPVYNIGLVYSETEEYQKAKDYYEKYLKLEANKDDYYYKNAIAKIEEIDKILDSTHYKKVNGLVNELKQILRCTDICVTHYTGISNVQNLLLNKSPLRISEGSFLNDTSEGQELFNFLDFGTNNAVNSNKELFSKRPFIGSFVDASKSNDLTLWRMYGKEALEEAKGCSLTINVIALKQKISDKISPNEQIKTGIDDIEFYRVAYRNADEFLFAGASDSQKEDLKKLMKELSETIQDFKSKEPKRKNEEIEIIELLNEVAYLFKSIEYQFENEIRLVINEAIGFEKKIDFDKDNFIPAKMPPKVYIELVPIPELISQITIGPKVERAEEWAATFHYHLANNKLKPEIHISKLPFK